MMRTPIEIMIDQATGHDPSNPGKRLYVTLHCPKCGRKQSTKRDPSDPPLTATVRIQCPKCVGGDFDTPAYLDANGIEIPTP